MTEQKKPNMTPEDVRNRMAAMLELAQKGLASARSIDVMTTFKLKFVDQNNPPATVSVELDALKLIEQEIKTIAGVLTGFVHHYSNNLRALNPELLSSVASLNEAKAAVNAAIPQPAAPAPEPQPVIQQPVRHDHFQAQSMGIPSLTPVSLKPTAAAPVTKPIEPQLDAVAQVYKRLEDQEAPIPDPVLSISSAETTEPKISIATVGQGMTEEDQYALSNARVPDSAHARLEYPSVSPVARFFFRDGTYQNQPGYPRRHIDLGLLPIEELITMSQGAYGVKNGVDDVDTPDAILIRMDEAGIAVLWNPILNIYKIFHMELNQRDEGFVHRWLHHKQMSGSYVQNTLNNLNRHFGFAK